MALVILRDEVKGSQETRRMFAPKKVTSLEHWYKAARKVLPEIPDVSQGVWRLENAYVSVQFVAWEVVNTSTHKRLYLTIDRSVPMIGG